MSRSTLLEVFKTKASWDLELSNSHGTGPPMWDFFFEKHCWDGDGWGQKLYGVGGATTFVRPFAIYHDSENMDLIFSKLKDTSIPLRHRAGLFLTCDRVILRREDLVRLAPEFLILAMEMSGYVKPKNANHWKAIGDYISKKAEKSDPRMLGIALNCTSVSDVWDDYPDDVGIRGTSEELFQDSSSEAKAIVTE